PRHPPCPRRLLRDGSPGDPRPAPRRGRHRRTHRHRRPRPRRLAGPYHPVAASWPGRLNRVAEDVTGSARPIASGPLSTPPSPSTTSTGSPSYRHERPFRPAKPGPAARVRPGRADHRPADPVAVARPLRRGLRPPVRRRAGHAPGRLGTVDPRLHPRTPPAGATAVAVRGLRPPRDPLRGPLRRPGV